MLTKSLAQSRWKDKKKNIKFYKNIITFRSLFSKPFLQTTPVSPSHRLQIKEKEAIQNPSVQPLSVYFLLLFSSHVFHGFLNLLYTFYSAAADLSNLFYWKIQRQSRLNHWLSYLSSSPFQKFILIHLESCFHIESLSFPYNFFPLWQFPEPYIGRYKIKGILLQLPVGRLLLNQISQPFPIPGKTNQIGRRSFSVLLLLLNNEFQA